MSQLQNRSEEIVGVRNRFLFRNRTHPLCRVGRYLAALIRLYQHSSVRCFRLCALSWRSRSPQRCSVLRTLSILVPPVIFHRMPPGLADRTVSRKVLGRFGIAFAFAFCLCLSCLRLCPFRLCCSHLSCLRLCLSCRLCLSYIFLLYPALRGPWVQHHQRPCPLVLGSNQTASS